MERDWKTLEKPSRVLSAYNFFFKSERAKILAGEADDSSSVEEGDASRRTTQGEHTEQRNESVKIIDGATDNSARKVGFKDLGKIVGRRWRRLSQHPEKIAEFVEAAAMDKERYRKEMLAFKEKRKQVTKMLREETKNDNLKKQKVEGEFEDLRPATNTSSNLVGPSTYSYAAARNLNREDRKQKKRNTESTESSKENSNTIFHGWGGASNGYEYFRPPTQSSQGAAVYYPPAALGDQAAAAATTRRSVDWEHPASRWPHYYQPPFYPYAVSDGRYYAAGYRAWNTTAETVEDGTLENNEVGRPYSQMMYGYHQPPPEESSAPLYSHFYAPEESPYVTDIRSQQQEQQRYPTSSYYPFGEQHRDLSAPRATNTVFATASGREFAASSLHTTDVRHQQQQQSYDSCVEQNEASSSSTDAVGQPFNYWYSY